MRRRGVILLAGLLAALAGGAWYLAANASLSALEPPGGLETAVATAAKRWLVARAARRPLPAAPANDPQSVANGTMQFGANCAFCHGQDGRTPTKVGTSLYPRAVRLDAGGVQAYSDAELYVVIRDGIRLTGMPGFGKIHSEQEIWNLVHYLRSLRTPKGQKE
jgi:mono/diheme cytochrome c family protein